MNGTRNLSVKQRGVARSILQQARKKGMKLQFGTPAAGTNGGGRIDRSFGCAVDAGAMGLKKRGVDPSNMKTFARKFNVSQAFAMGVSDGYEDVIAWRTGQNLKEIWNGYGYRGEPSGTRRDYRSGLNVGRAVRTAAVAV